MEKDLNLIRKAVWSFLRRNSSLVLEFDDLFSEACIAYLEAIEQFDSTKGQKSTFIWRVIFNRLTNIFQKSQRINNYEISYEVGQEVYKLIQPEDYIEDYIFAKQNFLEMINQLSEDARLVCNICIYPPAELKFTNVSKKFRGEIVRYLRAEKNWSWSRIWDSFREIKALLSIT